MSAPVRPPTVERLLLTLDTALLNAGPAELVTLDSPCCAFDAVLWAVSFAAVPALDAALAVSEVVEAARRWKRTLDWRRTIRDMAGDAIVLRKCWVSV